MSNYLKCLIVFSFDTFMKLGVIYRVKRLLLVSFQGNAPDQKFRFNFENSKLISMIFILHSTYMLVVIGPGFKTQVFSISVGWVFQPQNPGMYPGFLFLKNEAKIA